MKSLSCLQVLLLLQGCWGHRQLPGERVPYWWGLLCCNRNQLHHESKHWHLGDTEEGTSAQIYHEMCEMYNNVLQLHIVSVFILKLNKKKILVFYSRLICATMSTSTEWQPILTLREMGQCITLETAWGKERRWPTTLSRFHPHRNVCISANIFKICFLSRSVNMTTSAFFPPR